MLRSNLCYYSDGYTVVEKIITAEGDNDAKTRNENLIFKIMFHLDHAYQKLITHL